ncbi:TPA: hypothetical protein NV920_004312 [Escherichia coli]|nr:hypothetical protein [Escherichia coli]
MDTYRNYTHNGYAIPVGGYGDDDRHVNKVNGRISEWWAIAVGLEYRFGRRVTEYVVKR